MKTTSIAKSATIFFALFVLVSCGGTQSTSTAQPEPTEQEEQAADTTTTTNTNDTLNVANPFFFSWTSGDSYKIGCDEIPSPAGNPPGNGLYGHRNFVLVDNGVSNASYKLVENNRIGYNCLYETEQDAIDAAEMLGYPWAAEFESVEWSPNRGKITLVSLSPEE